MARRNAQHIYNVSGMEGSLTHSSNHYLLEIYYVSALFWALGYNGEKDG